MSYEEFLKVAKKITKDIDEGKVPSIKKSEDFQKKEKQCKTREEVGELHIREIIMKKFNVTKITELDEAVYVIDYNDEKGNPSSMFYLVPWDDDVWKKKLEQGLHPNPGYPKQLNLEDFKEKENQINRI
jgi:hypothetical protein